MNGWSDMNGQSFDTPNGINFGDCGDVVPYERMLELGFEPVVMQLRQQILTYYGKLSTKAFDIFGVFDYKLRQDIVYADKIMRGVIPIDNKVDLKKHLQKMNFARKISIADLSCSISTRNDLKAIIRGLPMKSLFGIYNTNTEKGMDSCVDIDTLSPRYVTIWSDKYFKIGQKQSRKLYRVRDLINNKLKYFDDYEKIDKGIKENTAAYKIERVAELQNVQMVGDKKKVSVVIHRDYCRILGRYMIVASLKAPDIHLGAYELMSLGGTTVFVFAKQVKFNQKADIKYSTGSERVYYVSCEKDKLKEMLTAVSHQIYQKIQGVYSEYIGPTAQFVQIEPWVISNTPVTDGENTENNSDLV